MGYESAYQPREVGLLIEHSAQDAAEDFLVLQQSLAKYFSEPLTFNGMGVGLTPQVFKLHGTNKKDERIKVRVSGHLPLDVRVHITNLRSIWYTAQDGRSVDHGHCRLIGFETNGIFYPHHYRSYHIVMTAVRDRFGGVPVVVEGEDCSEFRWNSEEEFRESLKKARVKIPVKKQLLMGFAFIFFIITVQLLLHFLIPNNPY